MTDPDEIQAWFMSFLASAMKHEEARRDPDRAKAWAMSMALIADQLIEDHGLEPAL
jgi:hypothetical protein